MPFGGRKQNLFQLKNKNKKNKNKYIYFFKQPLSFMPLAWPVCGYGCACVCLHAHVNLYEGLCVFLFV